MARIGILPVGPLVGIAVLVGLHNAMNACAAYAASRVLGLSNESIERGLSKARPPGRRLRLSPIPGADAMLLDDCYNANPASMLAALETLSEFGPASKDLAQAAREAGLEADRVLHTEDAAEAASRVRASLQPQDLVLVKASRATRLERVSDLLAPDAETH